MKNLKGLQNQIDTKKGQKLNDNQLSHICGGIDRRAHNTNAPVADYESDTPDVAA